MLARALVIFALVVVAALAVTTVSANPELEAELKKLKQDETELNDRFKKEINENYELIQSEVDEFIAQNRNGNYQNLLSAASFKQVSVLFAEFEIKKYAAVRRAIDISRNLIQAKLGQKVTTVEGEITIDGELFDLIRARVQAASLHDVYESNAFLWRYLRMWTNFDEGRKFGVRTKALFNHMKELEEDVNFHDRINRTIEDYCAKHNIKLRSSLMDKLNDLVKDFSEAEECSHDPIGLTGFACRGTVGSLLKKYVGEQLIKSITKNEEQCIKNEKGLFNSSSPPVKDVEKSDNYYYNQVNSVSL